MQLNWQDYIEERKEVMMGKPVLTLHSNNGAAGDRTPDLMTASHALSHLSYSPGRCWRPPRVQEP